MYRVIEAIHSAAHGKVFPAGAHITERDFPPHALAALLRASVIEDMSQPAPVPEAEPHEVPMSEADEAAIDAVIDALVNEEAQAESAPQNKRGAR